MPDCQKLLSLLAASVRFHLRLYSLPRLFQPDAGHGIAAIHGRFILPPVRFHILLLRPPIITPRDIGLIACGCYADAIFRSI